jgi:hypothetical protein
MRPKGVVDGNTFNITWPVGSDGVAGEFLLNGLKGL